MDAADFFAEIGYAIVEARSGDEALAILEGEPQIDLVFTDIQMPGQADGIEFANEISRRWPQISVVVTSGAINPPVNQLPENVAFVSKPFAPDAIKSAISFVCGDAEVD